MNTITVSHEKIHTGNLILVNAQHPVTAPDERDLLPAIPGFPSVLLKRDAANVLQLVLRKIRAGDDIVPVSGYRSAGEQTAIYNGSLKDRGVEYTEKFVALPRHSEHQTGLAIDLGIRRETIDFICPDFPNDGICGEFRQEAANCGFIERYPAGKESVTGIAHEPWHFRYVGYPHSEVIRKYGFTLEEYTDFLKNYPAAGQHLTVAGCGKSIEIFYVPAENTETEITLPEDTVYQISGNNTDGFVVTLWREKP